ncbi:MAG: putative membrane protein [uncultured archaeon A07HR60]|nr:MAG: putative membrane protein [uncultured archaeon A07HR60]
MQPYLPYALLAIGAYAMVPPLLRVATSGANAIPSNVATIISNLVLVVIGLCVVAYTGETSTEHLTSPKIPYVLVAGAFLGVGILSYYRALALGPVSVVTPLFGTFIVFSSAIGVFVLGESLTPRRILGVGFAIAAVYLVSGS